MNLITDNHLEELKNIVSTFAKYQKVMLLYDNNVSDLEISEIYNGIKQFCIFNKMNMLSIDEEELYDGYRLVIYVCEVNSFLKLKINREEFVNIFYPKDLYILPYFLNNNKIKNTNDYLLINSSIDINIIASYYFNRFYNYFNNVLTFNKTEIGLNYVNQEFNQYNLTKMLNELSEGFEFLDVYVLQETELNYKYLPLVDLILINAFLCFITSVKNHELMLVDVYKTAKEDCALIDKYYMMFNNKSFINLIYLNHNCLYNNCYNSKQKVFEYLSYNGYTRKEVEDVVNKIKNIAKTDDGILGYMYLYNIFSL